MPPTTEAQWLAQVLDSEYGAIYAYGLLGAQLGDSLRRQARAAYDAHRAVRDELIGLIRARAAEPPGPQLSYPVDAASPGEALALAAKVEDELAFQWLTLLNNVDALRARGLQGLQDSAVRAARWRKLAGPLPWTAAFPGRL